MFEYMLKEDVQLLIITGPVGVGKTSVGEELSGFLETHGVAHTFVDLDGLAKTYPRPRDDRFGEQLALKNLNAVWGNAFETGVRNLIIARVVESLAGIQRIKEAVGAARCTVVQLSACDETLIARVRRREQGAGRDWHEHRALELSAQLRGAGLADHIVDTDDKYLDAIAREIRFCIAWE